MSNLYPENNLPNQAIVWSIKMLLYSQLNPIKTVDNKLLCQFDELRRLLLLLSPDNSIMTPEQWDEFDTIYEIAKDNNDQPPCDLVSTATIQLFVNDLMERISNY